MTLPDSSVLFDSLESNQLAEGLCPLSSQKNELTRVSEVLAESGIPVADSLKQRMSEELVALIEEDGYKREPRCSA